MGDKYLMGLDAGSGSGRCVLVSLDGERLFSTKTDWQYFTPDGLPGSAFEFDPDQFWTVLVESIRATMKKANIGGADIIGVSSTSQREGIVVLDQNNRELYAGPNRDFRAPMEGMTIAAQHGDEIYQRTGHYPSGIFACARLQWFKKNQPETYEKMDTLLSINDWILFRLSGQKICEPTNASETALYDIHTKQWAFDLIDKLGLKNIFPEVKPAGTMIGEVLPSVAEATGLKAGTPVVVGGADTQCGLLGIGFFKIKSMGAISGTTTPVQMILDEAITDEQQRTWTSPYLSEDTYVLESNAGASGSIFQWVHDTFCESEVMKSDQQEAFRLMTQIAEQAQPGASGMLSHIGVSIMNAKKLAAPPSVFHFGMSPISSDFRSNKPDF
ncbi:MAG: FGGY-family carbohydrate kinase, partial [Anaerolineales bacterium]